VFESALPPKFFGRASDACSDRRFDKPFINQLIGGVCFSEGYDALPLLIPKF
jgi:hypothetical protein